VAQVLWAWSKGWRPSGTVPHSSREPDVRRPCSDFTDMLWHIINCCIIIIIIIIIDVTGEVRYVSNNNNNNVNNNM